MPADRIPFYKRFQDSDLPEILDFDICLDAARSANCDKQALNLISDEESRSVYKVTDSNLQWNVTKDGIELDFSILIQNIHSFFEKGGIACEGSSLGIGMICTSTVSDRLEAHTIALIDTSHSSMSKEFTLTLKPGLYRDDAIIRIVVYLEKCGTSPGYPKNPGTILGDLGVFRIILSENRTLFPVYEKTEPKGPLWWVVCDWSNIEDDSFTSEYVAVVFNPSHRLYPRISMKEGNPEFDDGFLSEVMSSAIQIIIEKAKESETEWNRIMSGASYPEGTIAYMIQYMHNTLEWDFSSPELTAKSIREYVYSKVMS